jgi:hypothetical protein
MGSENITLLTANDALAPVDGKSGSLVECASDAPWLPRDCVPVSELLGTWAEAKQKGAAVVAELLADEPEIEGVRHLYTLKEILIRASAQHQLMLHLDEWLRQNGIGRCEFRAYSPFAEALRQVREQTGSTYQLEAPPPPNRGRVTAAREYLRFKGMAGLLDLPWLAAQKVLPLHARMLQRHSAGPIVPRDWWFYPTFYTFTNIGLAYERSLGRQFRFLTELRGTADKPLRQNGRDWDDLYGFAHQNDLPSKREITAAQATLQTWLNRVETSDPRTKLLLMQSQEMREFFARYLPLLLLQTRALRRWMDKAQPALIVVGNEAWEGCLLQLARARGIPTIILQHGIFGDFYQLTEHSGDVIAVRGNFWREFLSEPSRRRSVVLNCDPPRSDPKSAEGKDLLFITTDYSPQTAWHSADLDDILAAAATAAFENKRRLIIRIHPRDSAEPYRHSFARVCAKLGFAPEVEFPSGPGLEEAIRNSAVALLYSSTVFLDCLRLGVPIVSLGWHDFAFREMIKKHGVFQFANDLKHLRKLLSAGLEHKLPVSTSYEQFLAPTTPEELRTFFEQHAAGRSAGA